MMLYSHNFNFPDASYYVFFSLKQENYIMLYNFFLMDIKLGVSFFTFEVVSIINSLFIHLGN